MTNPLARWVRRHRGGHAVLSFDSQIKRECLIEKDG